MKKGLNFAGMSDPSRNPHFGRRWTEPPTSHKGIRRAAAEMLADMRFRRKVQHLRRLGDRALTEFLAELGAERSIQTVIDSKLDRYVDLDAEALAAAGGDRFWPAPLREIRRAS